MKRDDIEVHLVDHESFNVLCEIKLKGPETHRIIKAPECINIRFCCFAMLLPETFIVLALLKLAIRGTNQKVQVLRN